MVSRIFRYPVKSVSGEKYVLGFDTGLDSQAFAQAKMVQFMTQSGFIIFPDGRKTTWKAEAVEQRPGPDGKAETMVIWGADFPGESLDVLLRDPPRREDAFKAVSYYLKAHEILANDEVIFPGASGVLVQCKDGNPDFPLGTVMFPPERLTKRSIEAGGDDEAINAEQWFHPDLKGNEGTVFTAAIMLYTVFSGETPFPPKDGDSLRQDIREGVFVPLRLSAPGLNKKMNETITGILTPEKNNEKKALKKKTSPVELMETLREKGEAGLSSWFSPVNEAESEKAKTELELYKKNKAFAVKTRRFVIRNTTIILVCLAVVIGAGLAVRSYLKRLEGMPTTIGMTPAEITEVYYDSFGSMNHEMMEACVSGKSARMDIDMVVNIYVITRTRLAYEANNQVSMTAQNWLDRGSPETASTVFGVTDLQIKNLGLNENTGEVIIEAAYNLWMPPSLAGEEVAMPTEEELFAEDFVPAQAKSYSYNDALHFLWQEDRWRITEIERTARF